LPSRKTDFARARWLQHVCVSWLTLGSAKTVTAQNDVMGELQFAGKTKVEEIRMGIDGNPSGI